MLTESGVFSHGIVSKGKWFTDFILEEDTFGHTLAVSNDPDQDWARLAGDEKKGIAPDEAYYSAAVLAKRLKVEGLGKVTPEQVLALPRADGQLLLSLSATLEKRRDLFRKETAPHEEGHPGDAQDGLPGPGADSGDEQGDGEKL
jgi:hypothetical protein